MGWPRVAVGVAWGVTVGVARGTTDGPVGSVQAGGGRGGVAVPEEEGGPGGGARPGGVGGAAPPTPVTVAVSEMGWPRVAVGVAWVVTVGVARVTTDVSLASLQAVVTGA